MNETPRQKHGRILRDLARKGSFRAVAHEPSPKLEAALEDVVTALLCRLHFKDGGRPVTFDRLAFSNAVNRYWHEEGMTKDDALLRAGEEVGAPLGNVKTRPAKLKRLERHYTEAERVKEADMVASWAYAADTNRRRGIDLEARERRLNAKAREIEQREADLKKREIQARTAKHAETIKKGQL